MNPKNKYLSHNQASSSMISMLGKANSNQEAKFTMSLLSGNSLERETRVHTSTRC